MSKALGRGFSLGWYRALFVSTSGRIGRESWWLGIACIAVIVVLINILASLAAFSYFPSFKELNGTSIVARFRFSGWLVLGILIIVLYPLYALSLKRRRDRGGSGWDVILYLAVNGLFILVQAFGMEWPMTLAGFGYVMAEVPAIPGLVVPTPTPAMQLAGSMLTVSTVLVAIPLGFLRGRANSEDSISERRLGAATPNQQSLQATPLPRWTAPAACLTAMLFALGAGFAYSRHTSGEIVVGEELPGAIAGVVGTVLSGQQGQAGNLTVSPLATFANRFGQRCRSFQVEGNLPAMIAVACRRDRDWIVSFATASQSTRGREQELAAHLQSIGASSPFTLEGEALGI